jgi:hypothetical protein
VGKRYAPEIDLSNDIGAGFILTKNNIILNIHTVNKLEEKY